MKNSDQKNKQAGITGLRNQLKNKQGKQYWRSLEELADSDAFRKFSENEFVGSPLETNDIII